MPWLEAASTADFHAREVVGVRLGDTRVAIYRMGAEYFATSDVCPHMGALLSFGCVVEGHVECPMHHALFDIRTGASDGSVTERSVRTFEAKVEGDIVLVHVPDAAEQRS